MSKWFTSPSTNKLGRYGEPPRSVFDGALSSEQARVLAPVGTSPVFLLVNRGHYYSLTTGFVDSCGIVVKYVETAGRATLVDVKLPIEPAPLWLIKRIYCACGRRGTRIIGGTRYCAGCVVNGMSRLKFHARKEDADGGPIGARRDEQSYGDKARRQTAHVAKFSKRRRN